MKEHKFNKMFSVVFGMAFLLIFVISGCGRVQGVPAPTLASIAPNSGNQGATVTVTLTGTNFATGATIGLSGSGITVSNVVVVSSTSITATFAIGLSTATGPQNVSVTTSGRTSNTVTFTVTLIPPTISSTNPPSGATFIQTNRKITATFSRSMAGATVIPNFTLAMGVTNIPGVVTYDAANKTAIFTPNAVLPISTVITATINPAGVTDSLGNPLSAAGGATNPWSFTTGTTLDATRPTVMSTNPASAAVAVPINQKITATFSEPMDSSTLTALTFTVLQGVTPVVGTVTYANNTAVFTPSANLAPSLPFTATITVGAKDLAGNTLTTGGFGTNPWTFTTGAAADVVAPQMASTNPASAALAVPINKTVSVTFNKAMDPLTINSGSFTLQGPGSTRVNGSVFYDSATSIATFTPAANLASNTIFTASVSTGVKDLEGNTLVIGAPANPWIFTSSAVVGGVPPVNLASATDYVILAGTSVTNTAVSNFNGDLGVSPGATFTPAGAVVNGTTRLAGALAATAQVDLGLAAADAAGRVANQVILVSGELGGTTLTPGLYKAPAGAFTITTLDFTLDAQGDPDAVWIFQTTATLTVSNSRKVILLNGARATNIFWQVGTTATIGTGVAFKGNILAGTSIAIANLATLEGRALAQGTTVTTDTNIITKPAR